MFNATHFTYDGVYSGVYGLQIADFEGNSVIESSPFSPSIKVSKPPILNRFLYNGITYENIPQHQFAILSEQPIEDLIRREILSWLVGRNSFKVLNIHQPDLEEYRYYCVFTDVQIIFVSGSCHGFYVTANFDSPYQRGKPSVLTVAGTGELKTLKFNNRSDILDDYVYPTVEFKSISESAGYNISILNRTDDASRFFRFEGLRANEKITVDNELKCITSDVGGEKLSHFNKNWLRLRHGFNTLDVIINGEVTIICPTYVMIGF